MSRQNNSRRNAYTYKKWVHWNSNEALESSKLPSMCIIHTSYSREQFSCIQSTWTLITVNCIFLASKSPAASYLLRFISTTPSHFKVQYQDRLRGPPILLSNGALPLGGKRQEREADHSPTSSAELYHHSPNTPSWRGAHLKYRNSSTIILVPISGSYHCPY